MAVIAILRDLWRHRRLVLVGFFIAFAAMLLVMFRFAFDGGPQLESRQYDVGVASTAVHIDSQSSQTVDLGGSEVQVDVAGLAARAKVLANLLAVRPLRDEIASSAGVSPDRLITELSSTTEPGAPPAVATDVAIDRDDPAANVVSLQTSETVPIITVNTQAPARGTAMRLATSTVKTLRTYLDTESAESGNPIPLDRQLVMRELGEPSSATTRRGPGKAQAVFVFLLLLGLWCGGVLVVAGLSRALWQQTAEGANAADARDLQALRLPPPDREDERPARAAPARVGERPDHELWLPPSEETPSRVA
jgi:hypothetical protein